MVCAGLGAEIPGEEDAKNKGENRREKNKKSGTSLVPPKIKPDLPVECAAPWECCGRVVRLSRKGQKDIW